jgi:ATP-dependent RNA circularization protein (DNA/RNA ligase family)
MFKKYEKTYRILIPEINVKGKFDLSKQQTTDLLNGEVVVEEKMDGANVGIIRHKKGFHLQKRGSLMGQGEHEQFGFFYNWAYRQNYEKLTKLPMHYLVYGELVYATHTIYYDRLPDFFLAFDIFTGQKGLNYEDRNTFCRDYGFHQVPLIAKGGFLKTDLFNLIPNKSVYGEVAEEIVVKRYRKNEYLRGKIVKAEFIKQLDESDHWMNSNVKRNKLQTKENENVNA